MPHCLISSKEAGRYFVYFIFVSDVFRKENSKSIFTVYNEMNDRREKKNLHILFIGHEAFFISFCSGSD